MYDEWHPLRDLWRNYEANLHAADAEGLLDDPESAQEVVYPPELFIGDIEREDIQEFTRDVVGELVNNFKKAGVNPNTLGAYLFRSLLVGMQWERERIGR